MAKARKFTGCAQDYLDWFKLDISEQPTVVLPNSQTGGSGLPTHDEDYEQQQVLPDYLTYQDGQEYVEKYQKGLVEDFRAAESSREQENSRRNNIRDFESVDIATLTTTNIEETVDPDAEKAQVYLHYDFTNRNRTDLPIFDHEKVIIDKLKSFPVIIISGDTGCGKSTQVPQFILDDAVLENKHANIVVTQPRKIAAISFGT
ncbi:unnamed protein product [Meganyctiphanes norvegica]|uniref:Uncharacterized protein n=1 Tax=Meganyctiphanes norvegica TaxID=48144 RepID=A0AAV2QJT5_MEGNR